MHPILINDPAVHLGHFDEKFAILTNFVFSTGTPQARTALGYTQREVAEAVSVSVRWYQKVESGRGIPSGVTTIRIVLFLHLNLEDIREEAGLIEPVSSVPRRTAFG